jgi:nicotinamide mononucleotide transporter
MPSLSLFESLAAIFGVLSVILARYAHIGVFPTGLVSTLLYIYICLTAGLYADMGINVWYSLLSVYGWWRWSRPQSGQTERPVAWANNRLRIGSLLLFAGSWVLLYQLLLHQTDSSVPLADSFTTALAIAGMYLMAEKKIENWLVWIVVDVASFFLYLHKGLPISALQFAAFTGLAVWGLVGWINLLAQRQSPSQFSAL